MGRSRICKYRLEQDVFYPKLRRVVTETTGMDKLPKMPLFDYLKGFAESFGVGQVNEQAGKHPDWFVRIKLDDDVIVNDDFPCYFEFKDEDGDYKFCFYEIRPLTIF